MSRISRYVFYLKTFILIPSNDMMDAYEKELFRKLCGSSLGQISKSFCWAQLARNLLICHDNDAAGEKMFAKWKRLYPDAVKYPTPVGKDIGEAIEMGFDVPVIQSYKIFGAQSAGWPVIRSQERSEDVV